VAPSVAAALAARSIWVPEISESLRVRNTRPPTRPTKKRTTTAMVTRSISLFRSISGVDDAESAFGSGLGCSVMSLDPPSPRVSSTLVAVVNSHGVQLTTDIPHSAVKCSWMASTRALYVAEWGFCAGGWREIYWTRSGRRRADFKTEVCWPISAGTGSPAPTRQERSEQAQ